MSSDASLDSSSGERPHSGAAERLLLTPEQVADALAIGRTRVYEMMAAGTLPSIRLGHSRRVARHALVRFVEELCEKAARG